MNKKSFDIYLEFNYSKLNLAAFNKLNSQIEYYKEQSYKPYIDSDQELNFDELQKLVEKNIIEMEKSIDEFVKDIYLIIETPQTMSIQLSVIKNNEGKNITKQDALYLIQDAKQQILKSHLDIRILHIIVENYVSDDVEYKFLPLEKNSKKFSIDVKFVCFPKNLLKNFEQLFLKQQIFINQFICLNYVKMFDSKDKDNEKNICELAKDIVKGVNKQEVVSIPKIIKKTGFFEKLFHLFR
jgi:cell division ATPase FtsA